MIKKEDIQLLVEESIADSGCFIVDVQVDLKNRIHVEIDSEKGVSVDDCVKVSRYIEKHLDRDKEDFELSVMSPGIGKPFKVEQQLQKQLDKEIEIHLKSGGKELAVLKALDEHCLTLAKSSRKKINKKNQWVEEELVIDRNDIANIRATINFNTKN